MCKEFESFSIGKFRVEMHGVLGSTNDYLKREAACGAEDGLCAIALRQTGGRGRLGRSFFSPEGGLYMSVLLRREIPVSVAHLLTPAAAVAVAQALEACGSKKIGIKWVNDLYADGKKVCGILVETKLASAAKSIEYAVVGIGINLHKPEGGFPDDIKNRAGAAFSADVGIDKMELAGEILKRLDALCEAVRSGSTGFTDEYRQRSVVIGRQVEITEPAGSYFADVLDIDRDCRLIIRTDTGVRGIFAGDAQIRGDFSERR